MARRGRAADQSTRVRRVVCPFPLRHISSSNMPNVNPTLIDKAMWLALGLGSAFVASFAVRNLLRAGWRTVTDEDPPLNPSSLDTDWNEAIVWTVVTGVTAGLTRLVARRGAAATWRSVTGSLPPGLEKQ